MRLLQASLALFVAASACATFSATDTQVGDAGADAGVAAPDAAPAPEASTHFCATKTLSDDHTCFDFDDDVLPAQATGWLVVQKGSDVMSLIPGGAHGSPFALQLTGERTDGGAATGAAIRRSVGGARPTSMTASFSAQRVYLNGTANDGSENYDLLVIKASNATQTDHLQVELRPDGKLNLLEVVTENASGVVTYSFQLALLDVPTLATRLTDFVVTVSILNGDSSRASITINGMPAASNNAQFQAMTAIDDVTWGDSAVSQGVGYRFVIDDLTLDVTR